MFFVFRDKACVVKATFVEMSTYKDLRFMLAPPFRQPSQPRTPALSPVYAGNMAYFHQVNLRSTAGEQGIPLSGYSPRDVLALALSQGTLDELPRILARAAYDPNTSVQGIAQVMASLEQVGIDFSGARAALANSVARHCARCHKTYRDRENSPNACVIYHRLSDEAGDLGGSDSRSCPCREMGVTLGGLETGECYRGWHTDDAGQVDYMSSSANPCTDDDRRCDKPTCAWLTGRR